MKTNLIWFWGKFTTKNHFSPLWRKFIGYTVKLQVIHQKRLLNSLGIKKPLKPRLKRFLNYFKELFGIRILFRIINIGFFITITQWFQ
jgi:hypothetical protein